MFKKFQLEGSALPTWRPLRDEDRIEPTDAVEDLPTGQRMTVGLSPAYKFLRGERASQARHLPSVNDVVRYG